MTKRIAGIDVHKRVLMAVYIDPASGELHKHRFQTSLAELAELKVWLHQLGVEEVVMESTAQYWKPVWLALETHFSLQLAQAWSNRAPRGKKTDFKDAERLVRRHHAGELTLSFVPPPEQRQWRSLTRRRTQLTSDRVRIQNQVESLLEETHIQLSRVVTDLFGQSGLRILAALARGETEVGKLVDLADSRLKCSPEELAAALAGTVSRLHRQLLQQHLEHLDLIDRQLQQLASMSAEALREQGEPLARLTAVPGIRILAAQQILAEVGSTASAFPSSAQFSSWIGVCPGRNESAEQNRSSRSTRGNRFLRSVLCQAAQAAVRTNNSFFQQKFKRLLPRLGYVKAVWAIAHHIAVVVWKILHDGASYIEYGSPTSPQSTKRRLQRIKKELRQMGFSDQLVLLATPPLIE